MESVSLSHDSASGLQFPLLTTLNNLPKQRCCRTTSTAGTYEMARWKSIPFSSADCNDPAAITELIRDAHPPTSINLCDSKPDRDSMSEVRSCHQGAMSSRCQAPVHEFVEKIRCFCESLRRGGFRTDAASPTGEGGDVGHLAAEAPRHGRGESVRLGRMATIAGFVGVGLPQIPRP